MSISPWLGACSLSQKPFTVKLLLCMGPVCSPQAPLGGTALTMGCRWGAHPPLSLSTGVYVQEMTDAGTAKLYAGLLGVGDEILQVNGVAVSGLGLARIRELLLRADTLSLRVLRHRPTPR